MPGEDDKARDKAREGKKAPGEEMDLGAFHTKTRAAEHRRPFGIRLGDANGIARAIVLADEISPDSCRLWDAKTREKLDKDRFRQDLGNVIESYELVAKRLAIPLPA